MAADILSSLRKRPSVHQLCNGIFMQEPVWLSEDLVAVPLKALGFATQANYTARYAHEVAGAHVDQAGVDNLIFQGKDALPIVAVVKFLSVDASPQDLEAHAEPSLVQARRVLGWISGDETTPFAMLTCTATESYFRMLLPHSNRRQRLGFGNTGAAYHSLLVKIFLSSKHDEHFEYALSLLHDALREANPQFKIARLFNCLECLAYKLKTKHGGKSRRAVKDLLGLQDGAMVKEQINGQQYGYDAIEIAGRLRDKLFHGVPFREEDLNQESRSVFKLVEGNPRSLISALQEYCELEIARWVNGASRGLVRDET